MTFWQTYLIMWTLYFMGYSVISKVLKTVEIISVGPAVEVSSISEKKDEHLYIKEPIK